MDAGGTGAAAPPRRSGLRSRPEPLGLDQLGREVQSFLPGTSAYRPWPPVLLRVDGSCGSHARCVGTTTSCADSIRDSTLGGERATDRCGPVIVCHGDFGAWNTLWQGDELVGVVDWDMAEPDLPIVDVAFLAVHTVPLRSDEKAREAGFSGPVPRAERLRALCDAYGGIEPAEVLEAAAVLHVRDRWRTIEWGADGREPWATFLSKGELATIEDDATWLREHGAAVIRSS